MPRKLAKRPATTTRRKMIDRANPVSSMEPLVMADSSPRRTQLNELAFELTTRGNGLQDQPGRMAQPCIQPNGDLEMVKMLVAAGADISACDIEHNNTP